MMLAVFFLKISGKTRSTFHIGMAFLYQVFFNLAYFIAGSFYHPYAAYHRWLTVGVIMISEAHYNMCFYYIDEKSDEFKGKILLAAQYLVSTAVFLIFVIKTASADKVFLFAGHYWDFDADAISKIIGIIIQLYLVLFIVLLVWKFVSIKDGTRWTILIMGATYLIGTIVPSTLNVLSREGLIDRGVFQISWDMMTVIGYSLLGVIYINYTRDRTSLMGKIIGISMVTLLCLLQWIGYYSFRDKEDAYDSIHGISSILSVMTDYKPRDLNYIVEHSLRDGEFSRIYWTNDEISNINFFELADEFYNASIFDGIRSLEEETFGRDLTALMSGTRPYFEGYRLSIVDYAVKNKADGKLKSSLLKYLRGLKRDVAYRYNKIDRLPNDRFRKEVLNSIAWSGTDMRHFETAIKKRLASSREEGLELKRELLRFLKPMEPAASRRYRQDGKYHYVAFMYPDLAKGMIYECGYSYLAYREYMHPFGIKLILMAIVLLTFVLLGFRLFFIGALVHPLKVLLDGLQQISRGDFDINIPVKVEDEIGGLTRNFNRMAHTMMLARKELDDYSNHLEEMVRDRTFELQKARDALWGEMALAKKIQTVLLPQNPAIEGYDVCAFMEPASEVGGDYYDVIRVKDKYWVVIGDVSGHGVPAGLIMMMLQTTIKTVINQNPLISPSDLISIINMVITENIKTLGEDRYVTMTVFSVAENGTFVYAGAHEDILIYRAERGEVESIKTNGMWLGIKDDIARYLADNSFSLEIDDVILLYTDGVIEALGKNNILFSERKLVEILNQLGGNTVEEIKKGIVEELKAYVWQDDITLIVIKRNRG